MTVGEWATVIQYAVVLVGGLATLWRLNRWNGPGGRH